MESPDPKILSQLIAAFHRDDADAVSRLLRANIGLRRLLRERNGPFGSMPIHNVKSAAMLDVLVDRGADINALTEWEPGGFHLLEMIDLALAPHAISRGATVTVHAAARLGLIDDLRRLISGDPALVHARGGDGKMPLHYAASVEIAEYLLDNGADINARDIDHSSTAAMYLVKSNPDITRYLISRGCQTDILMAAALGDQALADSILAADPEAIRTRVSDEWFPLMGSPYGGSIYQWELGWHVSAVQVARNFGHIALSEYLMDRCPPDECFLNACWLHQEMPCPVPVEQFTPAARRHLAHAARNNDTTAARLLLEAGFPLDARSQHNAGPLHWAAFHGNAELIRLLLAKGADPRDTVNEYSGTPYNWAQHGARGGWFPGTGDFPASLALLELSDITQ